ncbi:uncharacterized protein LOC128246229 [Mya arenaria]|uniref:uncharacterized protein LOC128246229 n=1 Tax=Mya arenaria TaxID=6604 RepID=UPI0022E5A19C|nr:uncharacterized protein LOC128246229 [Mya arenaria]
MSFKIINCSLQTTLQAGGTFTLTNSGSQLSRDSTVTTPVIPGADGFGHTDSLILNRYDCKHYKVTFSNDPNDDLTVDMNIELQGGLTKGDKPKCDLDWDDLSTENVEIKDPITTVSHKFTIGIYFITLDCESDLGKETCPNTRSDCVRTSDFLDDFFGSFSTPMKFFAHEAILTMEMHPGLPIAWPFECICRN